MSILSLTWILVNGLAFRIGSSHFLSLGIAHTLFSYIPWLVLSSRFHLLIILAVSAFIFFFFVVQKIINVQKVQIFIYKHANSS